MKKKPVNSYPKLQEMNRLCNTDLSDNQKDRKWKRHVKSVEKDYWKSRLSNID